jgi:peptidoglycan/xylan/chitin deacetylase (PgdA/CDA1 family)
MEIHNPAVRSSSLVSGRYRIYLEKQGRGPYENLPMIRNITAVGTMPLLTVSAPPDEMSDGSRSDMREIALCFDLYNDDTGLNTVLTALDRFNIKATFFINGEFIRQHPHAVREIADSGHEAASMFFAPIDLATSRYQIDGDFIARGLARNEDEFFRSTGEELKLFWHPPFYVASSEIIDAAAKAGYKTIRRDVDPMDSLSRDELVRMGIPQYTSSDMADLIINKKKPGSIIPIRLGLIHGGRSDYLFNRINVILDALVSAGYSVVPVSTIREK